MQIQLMNGDFDIFKIHIVLASNAADLEFAHRTGQTIDYVHLLYYFSTKNERSIKGRKQIMDGSECRIMCSN